MSKTSPLPFLLSFFVLYLFAGSYSLRCRWNQFKVEDVMGNLTCKNCPKCPPGEGLTPQCYSFVKYGVRIECKKCELGKSYSKARDIGSCSPCGICADHETEIKKCNLTSNSVCGIGKCAKGFYSEILTGDCQPCSFCCSFLPNHTETSNSVKDECKNMPFYQRCDANAIHCQAPKCRDNQYLVVTNKKGSAHCVDCKSCPAGTSPSIPCGRGHILESIDDVECMKCSLGKTYSEKPGTHPCKPCSATCSVGQIEMTPCNLTHDRVCGNCDEGFYSVNGTKCRPCSACCGDENDVQIPECVRQNLPKRTQCSFTQRSVTVCQEQSTTGTNIEQKSTITATLTIVIVGVIAIMALVFGYLKYQRNRGPLSRFFYAKMQSSLEEVPHGQSLSVPLEEPTAHGAQETLSFEKSGVLVQFNDTQSFFSDAQEIRLEICWDVNCMLSPQSGEVQLSPVIKFHPYGKQLSKPVQVRIPHSALVFLSNDWEIIVKSSLPHNETIWWKKENQFEVHNNEVSFQVDNLSSYVVIGTSLANGKPTKKRLQCAVFGGEGTVGMDYTAYLYVFDDCEASLEKIMQEERSSGRILLGSPQSIYVETVAIETAIKISVKQPVEGWTVGEIKPECITQKHLKESYQMIPRAEILFKHDNGRNRDFLCIFELTTGDSTTTICAVASIKEDPFRRPQERQPSFSNDRHRLVTGRNLCDPVIINEEKAPLCLEKLSKEVFHTVCMTLDRPLKGKGNWRHVGASLGFSEEEIQRFREEMLTPEGSPCIVMLGALIARQPLFTVAELVQILQARNVMRFDVVEILEPYLYEPIPV